LSLYCWIIRRIHNAFLGRLIYNQPFHIVIFTTKFLITPILIRWIKHSVRTARKRRWFDAFRGGWRSCEGIIPRLLAAGIAWANPPRFIF